MDIDLLYCTKKRKLERNIHLYTLFIHSMIYLFTYLLSIYLYSYQFIDWLYICLLFFLINLSIYSFTAEQTLRCSSTSGLPALRSIKIDIFLLAKRRQQAAKFTNDAYKNILKLCTLWVLLGLSHKEWR